MPDEYTVGTACPLSPFAAKRFHIEVKVAGLSVPEDVCEMIQT